MKFKRRIKYSLIPLLISTMISCESYRDNDVYDFYPKGAKLTKEVLKKSSQIILNKSELILVVDISKNWEYYDPHMLFYDQSLFLKSSSFLPSIKIDSLVENVIYAKRNEDKSKRRSWFRNDIPSNYKLSLTNFNVGKSNNRENKIVERIKYIDEQNVTFFIRASTNNNSRFSSSNTDISLGKFSVIDTLVYPLDRIQFDYKNQIVSVNSIKNDVFKIDRMYIPKGAILDELYDQILNSL